MQTRNPILDEFAKLTTGAMGLAQAAGDEAKAAWRAQTDRFVAEMDLVRRDEFDVLKDEIAALRAELAELKAQKSNVKKTSSGPSTAAAPDADTAG
ncbi:BMFP domain-containing protein YqiC [Brevundimonas bullata]|jgi:BMFP domain-containing protein YqiC|uniref:BMFP domain-containing protein YqiC n=1 Tax=Brevundimonas bullata TaxID=13160 RepID=A0A7W7IQH2_9CAUL|nr:accessory factor UbiK family protein [Brevundimonas bullata]MBB4798655.1 BMFP domain-containing protein YqiC [Brevundimonas bullata]MBB6383030.1 BMFP domain-containing protein YqiC [Brevundimonas bullata]